MNEPTAWSESTDAPSKVRVRVRLRRLTARLCQAPRFTVAEETAEAEPAPRSNEAASFPPETKIWMKSLDDPPSLITVPEEADVRNRVENA